YADNGIAAFKDAVARFMQREFQVELDPLREINHCIGTKTALAMLPAAFINPGGEVYRLPLCPQNDFLPDLNSIPADIRHRAKLLVINYPNSPTGKVATREF